EFVERRDVGQPRECLLALGFECALAEMLVHSRSPFCQASASSLLVSVRSASAAASFNAAVMASSSSMADQRWQAGARMASISEIIIALIVGLQQTPERQPRAPCSCKS